MRTNVQRGCTSQWAVRALSIGLCVGAACHETRKPLTLLSIPSRPVTDADRQQDAAHTADPTLLAQLAKDSLRRVKAVALLGATTSNSKPIFNAQEVDDERALVVGQPPSESFGPPLFGVAASDLGTRDKVQDFQANDPYGPVVAGVYLDKTPTGTTLYQTLHLSASVVYCVFLRHDPNAPKEDQGWRAYVVPSSGTSCSQPTSLGDSLSVQRTHSGIHPGRDDYPSVMRFDQIGGLPLILVRCGKAECYIGPTTGFPAPQPPNGVGDGSKQQHIRLWHDARRLALKGGDGNLHPKLASVIEPVDGIENFRQHTQGTGFSNTWQAMAWVRLDDDPSGTKYGKQANNTGMNMQQGLNLLWIAYDETRSKWMAQVQPYDSYFNPSGPPPTPAYIAVTTHTAGKPGIARFTWLSDDDGLWVSCDQGCCQVSAFALQ